MGKSQVLSCYRKESALSIVKYAGFAMQRILLAFGLLGNLFLYFPSYAQTAKQLVVPVKMDQGVVVPPPLSQMVRQDASALEMISSYQKVVGTGKWNDLEGSGEMMPEALRPNGPTASLGATLWILGHQGFRLDAQDPRGTLSIRIDGTYGAIRRPDQHVIPMDAENAMTGLAAFPQLQDPRFPSKNIILIDQGKVTVDGINLRRITLEVPSVAALKNQGQQAIICVTDLYFDPTTSLLVKSANVLKGTDPRLAQYVKVMTYTDYRSAGNSKVPFLLSESLNGQRAWTLQLNQVQFNSGIKEAYFHF